MQTARTPHPLHLSACLRKASLVSGISAFKTMRRRLSNGVAELGTRIPCKPLKQRLHCRETLEQERCRRTMRPTAKMITAAKICKDAIFARSFKCGSPDGAERNPGLPRGVDVAPDFAALHPGYARFKSPKTCLEDNGLGMTATQRIQHPFRPVIGQLAWSVRGGHGSFHTLEFGKPHIAIRATGPARSGRPMTRPRAIRDGHEASMLSSNPRWVPPRATYATRYALVSRRLLARTRFL